MQIIDELEPSKRGVYAGAIGYIDYAENLDTCIAIRTIRLENKVASIQAGAGIVADSVPEKEYEETINKARALVKALNWQRILIGNSGRKPLFRDWKR